MGKTFIIAEIGVNHNGDMDIARRLIDVAAEAGADAAKFQTFKAASLIVAGTPTVAYQKKNSAENDQYQLLKSLELDEDAHQSLLEHAKARGIEFMSTGFDIASLDFLINLGISRIKIPSGEITNVPLIERAAESGLPLIISTGMADLEEVGAAISVAEGIWAQKGHEGRLDVLHCTTSYPTALEDVNLLAMRTMAERFKKPVGYSDHTAGILLPPLAVAAGASMIEKHITLDRTMTGPDHAASIEPEELKEMVRQIRQVETLLGEGIKAPRDVEIEARALVRKGLKFARDLPEGHILEASDLIVLRPETGLPPSMLRTTIGKRLTKSVAAMSAVDAKSLSET